MVVGTGTHTHPAQFGGGGGPRDTPTTLALGGTRTPPSQEREQNPLTAVAQPPPAVLGYRGVPLPDFNEGGVTKAPPQTVAFECPSIAWGPPQ